MSSTLPAHEANLHATFAVSRRLDVTPPAARRRFAAFADLVFASAAKGAALLTLAILAGILVSLVAGAACSGQNFGLMSFLTNSRPDPNGASSHLCRLTP